LGTAGALAETPLEQRRSGYEYMSRETRAMQDDDATNPGMFWVLEGEGIFQKDCAGCHADLLKGVAARGSSA
jgi:sulfur-oxidizing protein SoxA